jgi:acyl carrier protein
MLQKQYGVTLSSDSAQTRAHFSSVRNLAAFVAANRKSAA